MHSESGLDLKLSPSASLPVVVSTIVHLAILGMLLPKMSSFPSSNVLKNSFGRVSVIKLTPAERAQLPNFSNTDVASARRLGALSSNSVGSLPLQKSTLTPLPSLPALPLPTNQLPPPLPPLPALPPIPTVPPIPYGARAPVSARNPYIPPLPSLPSLNQSRSLPVLPTRTLRYSRRPRFEPIQSPPNPDDLVNGRFNSRKSMAQRFNSPSSFDTSNTPLSPQEKWREKLIAERTAEIQQKRAAVALDTNNTTEREADFNYAKWSGTRFGEIKSKPIIYPIDGIYPKEACLAQLSGTAVVSMIVDSTGNVNGEKELIKSSGYPILNDQAIAQIQQIRHVPNISKIARPYLAQINFQYNPRYCEKWTQVKQDNSTLKPLDKTIKSDKTIKELPGVEQPAKVIQTSPPPINTPAPESNGKTE